MSYIALLAFLFFIFNLFSQDTTPTTEPEKKPCCCGKCPDKCEKDKK